MNHLKKHFKLVVGLLVVMTFGLKQTGVSQQALWTNYQFSYLGINPAFTGQRGYLGVTGLIGSQFTGSIRPQAVSQIVIADSPLANSPNHNIGFQGFNSNLGNINNTGLNLTYAYRYFGEGYNISLGADAGFMVQPNTLVNNAINLLTPFAGVGAAVNADNFFLSASNPLLFVNENRLITGKKPWFFMGGVSLGSPDKLLVNLSSLIELNNNLQVGNGADVNAKVWIGGRAGIGASYRMSGTQRFEQLNNKVILSLEYQFSTSIRMGLSFDENPLQGVRFNQFGGSGQVPSVFQLAINYRALPKNIPTARFDYY
jgi:hypothetical protein